jgi:uncharacterized protein (DUF58 family)
VSTYFIPFLLILFILAAILRDNFFFSLLYLFAGIYFLGRYWSERSFKAIRYKRIFSPRVFFGEEIPINIEIRNAGWLPIVWLGVTELLPLDLTSSTSQKYIVSLPPYGKQKFQVTLQGRKRGYYPIGPTNVRSGDIFGLWGEKTYFGKSDFLTVYPKILPLAQLQLPSRMPLGTLAYHEPIYEDPTRVVGKRDYVVGDSLRRVDWKATASSGRLQVKLFEPSISIETAIFLDLNRSDYYRRSLFATVELAITTAASVANWVIDQRQAVGLYTNGVDATEEGLDLGNIPPNKGRGHLIRVLENLAKVKATDENTIHHLMQQESLRLSWGTTLVLITGLMDDDLFDELFQVRRRGLQAIVFLIGTVPDLKEIQRRGKQYGIPIHHIYREEDLRNWRS